MMAHLSLAKWPIDGASANSNKSCEELKYAYGLAYGRIEREREREYKAQQLLNHDSACCNKQSIDGATATLLEWLLKLIYV